MNAVDKNIDHFDLIGKGYVRLLSATLTEHEICEEARLTRGVETGLGEINKEQDQALISTMIANGHGTPFEMAVLRFEVQTPIFVKNQWFRHRTGTFLERSLRHIRISDTPSGWFSSGHLRGCSGPELAELESAESELNYEALKLYNRMVDSGVPKEQARRVLPLSTWTFFHWKVDLRNLLHFLELRCDMSAQYEIRQYALRIALIVFNRYPMTMKTFIRNHPKIVELQPLLT